ncbi:aldose 1-epimerase family protein [soil metagenome]
MSFSHREETRGDRLLDILTDENAGIRLIVSRLGAELISLARRDSSGNWIAFLYRDNDIARPERGWANHATVMGYFLHRLKDGRSSYRGTPIEGGTHSFLRTKVWQRVGDASGDHRLTYRMTREHFTPTEYPLDVSLDLTYALRNKEVIVTFSFENHDPQLTAHLGFGLHPGFAAGSFESFSLQMPRGTYRRHSSPDNFLSGETKDIEFEGGEMPFAREKLAGSYILELLDVPERTFTYEDLLSGRSVALDFSDVPYITLWSDGGPFLCVEPCWGLTDHHQQRAFEEKEGMQTIPAGGSLQASFRMSPRMLAPGTAV